MRFGRNNHEQIFQTPTICSLWKKLQRPISSKFHEHLVNVIMSLLLIIFLKTFYLRSPTRCFHRHATVCFLFQYCQTVPKNTSIRKSLRRAFCIIDNFRKSSENIRDLWKASGNCGAVSKYSGDIRWYSKGFGWSLKVLLKRPDTFRCCRKAVHFVHLRNTSDLQRQSCTPVSHLHRCYVKTALLFSSQSELSDFIKCIITPIIVRLP